jgi:hypothetical protein
MHAEMRARCREQSWPDSSRRPPGKCALADARHVPATSFGAPSYSYYLSRNEAFCDDGIWGS